MDKSLIYFVPGIKGSVLFGVDYNSIPTKLWPPEKILTSWSTLIKNRKSFDGEILKLKVPRGLSEDQPDPNVNPGGVINDVDICPIPGFMNKQLYGHILNYIEVLCERVGGRFVKFSYDWRRSIEFCARELSKSLNKNTDNHNYNRIILICHSYGGLVARHMVENKTISAGAPVIDYILNIGTPHYGSMKSVKYLSGEGSMAICSDAALLELCETFDCLYDTVPVDGIFLSIKDRDRLYKSRARRKEMEMFRKSDRCKIMVNINIIGVMRMYKKHNLLCNGDGVVDVKCDQINAQRHIENVERDLKRETEHLNILKKEYIYKVIRYIIDTPVENYSHANMLDHSK